jgi:hypothetical protein
VQEGAIVNFPHSGYWRGHLPSCFESSSMTACVQASVVYDAIHNGVTTLSSGRIAEKKFVCLKYSALAHLNYFVHRKSAHSPVIRYHFSFCTIPSRSFILAQQDPSISTNIVMAKVSMRQANAASSCHHHYRAAMFHPAHKLYV